MPRPHQRIQKRSTTCDDRVSGTHTLPDTRPRLKDGPAALRSNVCLWRSPVPNTAIAPDRGRATPVARSGPVVFERMEPTETVPTVDPDREAALAADATADRRLSPAAEASLARAIDRLPEAMAESDSEGQAAAK